ncbi:MAG: hypothetical protein KC420_14055, partial [Myxococcales bacterium]|nr:hypothetical protein [Myxococcales bacterium]
LAELPPPPGLADARALVDGRQRIADLAAIGGQPLLAWIYALVVLDRVDLVEAPVDDRSAIDRRRIRARSAAARAGDYFALLGLPITASRAEIRRALTELGRTFADERLEPATRSALAGELAERRAGLAEARDVLLDDGLRAAYLAHREGEQ